MLVKEFYEEKFFVIGSYDHDYKTNLEQQANKKTNIYS